FGTPALAPRRSISRIMRATVQSGERARRGPEHQSGLGLEQVNIMPGTSGMNSGSAAEQAATNHGNAHLEIFRRRLEQCAFAGDENLDAAPRGLPQEILRALSLLDVFHFGALQDAPEAKLRGLAPAHASFLD